MNGKNFKADLFSSDKLNLLRRVNFGDSSVYLFKVSGPFLSVLKNVHDRYIDFDAESEQILTAARGKVSLPRNRHYIYVDNLGFQEED